ncbi:hypothetical protein ABPG74_018711 [Tetrahymena malaccensis]
MIVKENPKIQGNNKQYLPAPYKKKRYYTPQDIKVHNTANDCWLSFFNKVIDLTPLIQASISSPLCKPLIDAAGTDITYWFDSQTREPRKKIDLQTGQEVYYCPLGQFLHIPPQGPNSTIDASATLVPWWRNPEYQIGLLSYKVRKIKIVNMLSDHEDVLVVPSEETINEILERYKTINYHAASYTWKRMSIPLDMDKNLEENGIPDETVEFEELDIPETEWYIPAIHLYFNDDLTVA